MSASNVKSERILIRVTKQDKELIEKAAGINDRSLADWVRKVAVFQSRVAVDGEMSR